MIFGWNFCFHISFSSPLCLQIIYLKKSPEETYNLLLANHGPHFLPFRDAAFGPCSYHLYLFDCLKGLHKVSDSKSTRDVSLRRWHPCLNNITTGADRAFYSIWLHCANWIKTLTSLFSCHFSMLFSRLLIVVSSPSPSGPSSQLLLIWHIWRWRISVLRGTFLAADSTDLKQLPVHPFLTEV